MAYSAAGVVHWSYSYGGAIHQAIGAIAVTVPYGVVTSLVGVFNTDGGSVTANGIPQVGDGSDAPIDFTNPVTYTVTAVDSSTQNYVVTVQVTPPGKDFTYFNVVYSTAGVVHWGYDYSGAVHNGTVAITVPYGLDVTSLIGMFGTTGVSVSANGITQVGNGSDAPIDFTNPVTYTITAADGSTQNYIVTVMMAQPAKDITSFYIYSGVGHNNYHGSITGNGTIGIIVPYGADVTNLTPVIMISSGASVSPASGVAQDFTNPVKYTVTGADNSTQVYTVAAIIRGPAGGYIFYDKGYVSDGWRYLEAAPYDAGYAAWSDVIFQAVPGGTDNAIGSGQINTINIINQSTNSAAYHL